MLKLSLSVSGNKQQRRGLLSVGRGEADASQPLLQKGEDDIGKYYAWAVAITQVSLCSSK